MNNRYFIAAGTAIVIASTITPNVQAAEFPDVNVGTEMGDAIYHLANQQIINGYPDGQFKAHLSVTRGQVAKILANTLQLDYSTVENPGFQDIPKDHLFYPYIGALANIGVFNSSASHFHPDRPMTRGEVAKVLTIAFDLPSVGEHPFHDVNDQWAYYINALFSNGITKGAYPTQFGINSAVTRGELAVFIYRLQQQLSQVQATFTSEQFEFYPIAAKIVPGFGDESAIYVEAETDPVSQQSEIKISAKDIGWAYVYVGKIDPATNDWSDTPHLYRFTSSLEQGKLQLKKEIQTEPVYAAVQLPIYDGVGPFSFTYTNGKPVAEQSIVIESKRNEFDGQQEQSIWLKNVYGELLVSYTAKDGEAKQKAVFVEQKPYYLQATVGDFVLDTYKVPLDTLAQYGITESIIDSKVFEGQVESSKVQVNLVDDHLLIRPEAEGNYTLYLVDSQYRLHPVSLHIQKFSKGYLLQLND